MPTKRPYAEESIWRPIAVFPDALGFPGAAVLNHVQLGDQSGYIDLVLFPERHPKIVLVEAKRAADSRSAADVIGQLLKYYTHALALGSTGIDVLHAAAAKWGCGERPSRLPSRHSPRCRPRHGGA